MALIRGIHIIAKGNKTDARCIAEDIRCHQRLLIGDGSWSGGGAYAFYADELPDYWRESPQVLFEIDDEQIVPLRVVLPDHQERHYFMIPGTINEYVSIRVLAFAHLEA